MIHIVVQSVTVYASEIAPPKYRGGLNMLFQWFVTIGIIVAQLINYGTETLPAWGWRISLCLAAVPGFLILIGSFFLPETPSFLIAHDRYEEGMKVCSTSCPLSVCFSSAELVDMLFMHIAYHSLDSSPQRKLLVQLA